MKTDMGLSGEFQWKCVMTDKRLSREFQWKVVLTDKEALGGIPMEMCDDR